VGITVTGLPRQRRVRAPRTTSSGTGKRRRNERDRQCARQSARSSA
jgi:hypothetical protein